MNQIINSKMHKTFFAVFFSGLLLSACTKPGETTSVGAATGGVLGAGMGAIVGSQSGEPGAGLAIGALAGAAAGAAVGNALEAHEQIMQRQDEAIERQQRIISSQQTEIQELRRISQDSIAYRDDKSVPAIVKAEERAAIQRTIVKPKVKPQSSHQALPTKSTSQSIAKVGTQRQNSSESVWHERSVVGQPSATTKLSQSTAQQSDCFKAEGEVSQAKLKEDVSDKLFHYRRALRLCPTNADYHSSLGELYLSLNRRSDAQYEFQEALKLDPNNQSAKTNLSKVRN